MRRVMYGSAVVVTTDEVASALLQLAVSLANLRQTEAVTIPIITGAGTGEVDLVIGTGLPLLAEPAPWAGKEPDFFAGATLLRMHRDYPYRHPGEGPVRPSGDDLHHGWDPDLDGY